MDKLKPCPFCGNEAKFEQTSHGTTDSSSVRIGFRIMCVKCGATAPRANGSIAINLGHLGELNCWKDDREDAAACWNRRAGEDGWRIYQQTGGD